MKRCVLILSLLVLSDLAYGFSLDGNSKSKVSGIITSIKNDIAWKYNVTTNAQLDYVESFLRDMDLKVTKQCPKHECEDLKSAVELDWKKYKQISKEVLRDAKSKSAQRKMLFLYWAVKTKQEHMRPLFSAYSKECVVTNRLNDAACEKQLLQYSKLNTAYDLLTQFDKNDAGYLKSVSEAILAL